MNIYPHYIVQCEKGRLRCPPQYRRTHVEKMFVSGKIGGKKLLEYVYKEPKEAQRQGLVEERNGFIVRVYKVSDPNGQRRLCREWRRLNWSGA